MHYIYTLCDNLLSLICYYCTLYGLVSARSSIFFYSVKIKIYTFYRIFRVRKLLNCMSNIQHRYTPQLSVIKNNDCGTVFYGGL